MGASTRWEWFPIIMPISRINQKNGAFLFIFHCDSKNYNSSGIDILEKNTLMQTFSHKNASNSILTWSKNLCYPQLTMVLCIHYRAWSDQLCLGSRNQQRTALDSLPRWSLIESVRLKHSLVYRVRISWLECFLSNYPDMRLVWRWYLWDENHHNKMINYKRWWM